MMLEKQMRFELPDGAVVILRFVWEHGSWVCRADNEFIEDLDQLLAENG